MVWLPMKPEPPVTKTVLIFALERLRRATVARRRGSYRLPRQSEATNLLFFVMR
jgi:hypothetical protein